MSTPAQIRWLIRRDMPAVLDIDHASHDGIWSDDDFLACLRKRNCIGMVAEEMTPGPGRQLLGFMVYELFNNRLAILRFAVHPDHRRQRIGTQMITRLKDKLAQQRRNVISTLVGEGNLEGQQFLREAGFKCVRIVRSELEDDQYEFRFKLDGGETELLSLESRESIA